MPRKKKVRSRSSKPRIRSGASPRVSSGGLSGLDPSRLLLKLFVKAPSLSERDLFGLALDMAVRWTDSTIGFFHRVSDDQKSVHLTRWNDEALKNCQAVVDDHYPLERAGNWADCVRLKRPVIYNDFQNSPNRKGLPEGHAPLTRIASIPVLEGDKVLCIFGVGNKPGPYDDQDILHLELVANAMQVILNQRRVQQEYSDSAEKYRILTENMTDVLYRVDLDGTLVYISPNISRYGFRSEELTGRNLIEHIHPDDRDYVLREFQVFLETGRETLTRFRIRDAQGRYVWFEETGRLLRDPDGRLIGSTGILRDITDRMITEEALQERDRRLARLASQVPGMIYQFMVRPDGTSCLPYASENITGLFGCTAEEVRHSAEPIIRTVHPEDLDNFQRSIEESARNLSPWKHEYRTKVPGHPVRWMLGQSTPERLPDGSILWHGFTTDITDRKATEQAIHESEQRFRSLFDSMSEWVVLHEIVTDDHGQPVDYRIIDCNPAFTNATGIPRDRAVGALASELYQAPEAPYLARYAAVATSGTPDRFETYFPPMDRSFDISVVSPRRGNFVTITSDITERKRMESALHQSEEMFSKSFQNSPLAQVITRFKDGKILTVNETFVNTFLFSREELLGRTSLELGIWVDPDERRKAMANIAESEQIHRNEIRFRRKDGAILSCLFSANLIEVSGEKRLLSTIMDVTAQRQAEAELQESEHRCRSIVENLNDALYLHDFEGKILDCNDNACRMTGYSREELVGAHLSLIDDPVNLKLMPARMQNLIDQGMLVFEGQHLRKDGTPIPVEISARVVTHQGRGVAQSFARDITLRKQYEHKIQNLLYQVEKDNEELRKLDQMKNDFLATVSHELRTPLTSIIGYLKLMADPRMGPLPNPLSEFVDSALRNSKRLLNLINNILDVNFNSDGKLPLRIGLLNAEQICSDAIHAIRNLADEKRIRIEPFACNANLVLRADREKLERVLINLLSNAVKFTPLDGVIHISATRGQREGVEGVLFRVADNGPGIPPDHLDRIFDRFYQIDNTITRRVGGSGLGLTICKQIVEAHGGRIWAESPTGQGATLAFLIPDSAPEPAP